MFNFNLSVREKLEMKTMFENTYCQKTTTVGRETLTFSLLDTILQGCSHDELNFVKGS